MKRVLAILTKRYELWPLSVVVGVTVCGLVPGFIVWSSWKNDFALTHDSTPGNNPDLQSRKDRQIKGNYDELVKMGRLYKEMDERQRQVYEQQQSVQEH